MAGSGDVKAGALTAKGATVSVAGSGDVEVTLDGGSLSATVAGSGDVVWHGKAMVEQGLGERLGRDAWAALTAGAGARSGDRAPAAAPC